MDEREPEEEDALKIKEKYLEALSDITYKEWYILRESIDQAFNLKASKLKRELRLADLKENVKQITHSQFLCEWD